MTKKISVVGGLIIIIFLLVTLRLTVSFIRERTVFLSRAFAPLSKVAIENCYLFASPLSATADGKEKIRVTIFVSDSQGRGVSGQTVTLAGDQNLEITVVQGRTDSLGRVIFDVATAEAADYFLEAKVENQAIPGRLKIVFR
jgi:hypothetical protein